MEPREKRESNPLLRYVGIDVGSETIKAVELIRANGTFKIGRRRYIEHDKQPYPILLSLLREWDWDTVRGAAVSGRLSTQVNLPHIPVKQAISRGYRFLCNHDSGTIVSLGGHGFSVLELRLTGLEVLRENSLCAQGTGNFLRQLVERFSLSIAATSELCADVDNPAPLSGRCPVILKTDMTHLANKGEERARILAGLFDAICHNVFTLIKPGIAPPELMLIGGVSRSRRVRKTFREYCELNGFRAASFIDAISARTSVAGARDAIWSRLVNTGPP